jgi:hypothetical protein
MFCEVAGFHLGLVPSGALLVPPTCNEFDECAFEEIRDPSTGTEQPWSEVDEIVREEESAELTVLREDLDRIYKEDS